MKPTTSLALAAAAALASTDGAAGFVAPRPAARPARLAAAPPLSSVDPTTAAGDAFGSALHLAASSPLDPAATSAITTYLAERLIDAAVPAAFAGALIFFFFSQLRKSGGPGGPPGFDDDARESATAIGALYDDLYASTGGSPGRGTRGMNPFRPPGPPPLPKNIGLPRKEYLRIENVNEQFDAYDFSLTRATESKARAAADFRSKAFDRALGRALNSEPDVEGSTVAEFLAPRVKAKLVQIEKECLKEGRKLVAELRTVEGSLASAAMDAELAKLGAKAQQMNEDDLKVMDAEVVINTTEAIDVEAVNSTEASAEAAPKEMETKEEETKEGEPAFAAKLAEKLPFGNNKSDKKMNKQTRELVKQATELRAKVAELELDFVGKVLAAVGPKRAIGLRNALMGDIAVRGAGSLLGSLEERPLSSLLRTDRGEHASSRRKSVFVMDFPGDVQASQLNELREEVTGVVRSARPGDEALVVLQSGGGTVTGYGLAAGQLARLKERGMKLTIAVEQVAASGGYMMSCVADRIVASPFAVIGSIGVISEIPNVYERLKEEGIQFQTVTAGKFKRTLTPTKKITKEDLKKSEEDIGEIFELFKGWVAQNRPQLDIDAVATGETWFGPAALEKGLCDEIRTVDDLLLDYIEEGSQVYRVRYDPPPEVPNQLQALFAAGDGVPVAGKDDSLGRRAIRWLVRSFAEEVRDVTGGVTGGVPLEERYMARDDTQDRIRASADNSRYY